jgi:hypothetical protein
MIMNRSFYRNFYAAETFLSVPFFGWLPKKGTYYNIVSYFGTPKNRKTNKYIADYLWINFSDEKTEENRNIRLLQPIKKGSTTKYCLIF